MFYRGYRITVGRRRGGFGSSFYVETAPSRYHEREEFYSMEAAKAAIDFWEDKDEDSYNSHLINSCIEGENL